MNTAYISTHKGKRGLRFVCKCGFYTWLRTNEQRYYRINEKKEVKALVKAFQKEIREHEAEATRNNKLWVARIYSKRNYELKKKLESVIVNTRSPI
jgi:uncharacterized radical SAM superfamily Fe-S cluster-containing enzyme